MTGSGNPGVKDSYSCASSQLIPTSMLPESKGGWRTKWASHQSPLKSASKALEECRCHEIQRCSGLGNDEKARLTLAGKGSQHEQVSIHSLLDSIVASGS